MGDQSCTNLVSIRRRRSIPVRAAAATGRKIEVVHIVGGGARNRLLCQLTASAAARPVLAGPVEATSFGNVLVQALGAQASPAELRDLVLRSTALERYEPHDQEAWSCALARFERMLQRASA